MSQTKTSVYILRGVADCGESNPPQFAEGTHHMKDDTGLPRLIEVNTVTRHNVEEIVWRENTVKRRSLMVTGHKAFLLAKSCGEDPCVSVVNAIS